MLRIQVLTPFRLQFRNKDIWLTAHENYYLDTTKEAEREELKYILSPLFPYRDFIYIDEAQVSLGLLKEVNEEKGFTQVGEPYEMVQPEVPSIVTDNLIAPVQEPAPNRFVDTNSPVEIISDEPTLAPALEVEEPEIVEEKPDRLSELTAMSYKKIKEIAEGWGIEYTNKADTIEAILLAES